MRVALLTQHYAPEVTAGRFRVEAFAEAFAERGHEVDVICPVPNHPEGMVPPEYRRRAVIRREVGGARVSYVWVKVSPTKTPLRRLAYYGSYAAMALAVTAAGSRPDLILASSPPLSVAAAAAAAARLRRVPWIFDVRDIWPKAAQLIGELTDPRLVRAAERLERALYNRADHIVVVTRPFREEIRLKAPEAASIALIPNGTTREWLDAGATNPDRASLGLPADRFIWTYAGNLGPSRRLDVALGAARRLGDGCQLLIIGSGGARDGLREQASDLGDLVTFRDLMQPADAARHLRASDALLVPQQPGLGDFVPSKLYDCCAVGRPVIVAADGETLRLATEADIGLGVEPEDADAMAEAVERLRDDPALTARLAENGRSFATEYLRERQSERMVDLAESVLAEGRGRRPGLMRRAS